MKLELKPYGAFCSTEVFIINGMRAESSDFGEQYDRDRDNADDYACGDMTFTRINAKPEVLSKYGITEAEYELVAAQLEAVLSFGSCGWCV